MLAQSTETGQQAVQELMLKQTAATWQDPLASDGTSMPLLGSLFWMWNEPLIGSIGANRRGGMWPSALWQTNHIPACRSTFALTTSAL